MGKNTISVLNIETLSSLKFLETQNNRMGVVLDGDCNVERISSFLRLCGTEKFFDVKHHWLILTSNKSISTIFENVELYINADIHIVYAPSAGFSSVNFTVEDVYNPAYGKGGKLQTKTIGYYSAKDGYRAREMQCKYWMRRNMSGVTLKSRIVLPIPFEGTLLDYLNSEANPEVNTFNRFHYNVMRPCVNYYNFTPHLTLSESWGYLTKNGTWDGLVAALDTKSADYGSSPLFFYSASLVSTLLMKPDTKIKTIEDILGSEMKVGCEDILYNRDYFMYTIDKPSRKLYLKKVLGRQNTSNFLPPEEGLALVKNGGYAFHVELATAYPIIQKTFPDQTICQLREVQMYKTQPMHANVQKHSPFRDMFDTW
ncbi:unnamed protein product [Phaedon cochleariae]|uniref:Ionotropic receptor 75a N-terminal domain-containing protein n=1 Tax=Phaedon cochleariae TaxID=80249 RepID=A0A9P0GW53_PHACE|nr:unnamed protein product [Phaedon cochleariae]